MGPISVNVAWVGKLDWSKELLTMTDNGSEITKAAALISLGRSPSQHVDIFVLRLLNIVLPL